MHPPQVTLTRTHLRLITDRMPSGSALLSAVKKPVKRAVQRDACY